MQETHISARMCTHTFRQASAHTCIEPLFKMMSSAQPAAQVCSRHDNRQQAHCNRLAAGLPTGTLQHATGCSRPQHSLDHSTRMLWLVKAHRHACTHACTHSHAHCWRACACACQRSQKFAASRDIPCPLVCLRRHALPVCAQRQQACPSEAAGGWARLRQSMLPRFACTRSLRTHARVWVCVCMCLCVLMCSHVHVYACACVGTSACVRARPGEVVLLVLLRCGVCMCPAGDCLSSLCRAARLPCPLHCPQLAWP